MTFMSSRSLAFVLSIIMAQTIGNPAFGFRVSSSISTYIKHCNLARHDQHHDHCSITTLLLSSPDGLPDNIPQEEPDEISQSQTEPRILQQTPPTYASRQRQDPLIASLTRIDEPTPTTNIPIFGEIPADGNLGLLVPAAAIAVLGFVFSIVVAFSSRDVIVQELSKVDLPEMKYKPTVVKEGQCRGLCSNQKDDLDGLRNFMESISKREATEM